MVNGSTPNEGAVEVIANNGSWGIVCGYGWDSREASVVCRMLGYGGKNIIYFILS